MDLAITSWGRRISSFKSEALWVFLGQTGNALGVLLGMKVLTQVLDPFEFGRLSIGNTVICLSVPFIIIYRDFTLFRLLILQSVIHQSND